MALPHRQTARLRWGCVSLPDAVFFVTACTKCRAKVLTAPAVGQTILAALREIHLVGDAEILAATLMPDHVHLLFELGARLSLGQTIGKFKALGSDRGRAGWRWQEESFEHRLRPPESPEDYAFYIFMNPYQAGLVSLRERWRWWHCPDSSRFRFLSFLDSDGFPPTPWLRDLETVHTRIVTA